MLVYYTSYSRVILSLNQDRNLLSKSIRKCRNGIWLATLGVDTNFTKTLPDIPIEYWRLPVPVMFASEISIEPMDTIIVGCFTTHSHSASVPVVLNPIVQSYFMNMQPALYRPVQPGDVDYVMVIQDEGCYSYVGRQNGMQKLSVGEGCEDQLIVTHLSLHTLGMWHENNRADRDEYITIHPENIKGDSEIRLATY